MKDSIFRLYDIRGVVGSEILIDKVYDLARSFATYFINSNFNVKKIAVGIDGRTHSAIIKNELIKAFLDSGFEVIFIGVCPTPVLYFSQYNLDVDAGIMITASHNTKEYNGFKICLNKETVWGSEIIKIKEIYKSGNFKNLDNLNRYQEIDAIDLYINWLSQNFKNLYGQKISVLIDCANGATGTVWPRLIKALNLKSVGLLYENVDGTFPNHEADPVVELNMQDLKEMLKVTDYKFAIGLDGDGDRMAPLTKSGYLVPGDKLLAIFSKYILENNSKSNIVFDIKCSQNVAKLLRSWGANAIMAPSGHSIIKHYMKENNALFAGELSCHFFFKDRYFGYDDGIYAALRLMEILQESTTSLEDLVDLVPDNYCTPEIRINCSQEIKDKIIDDIKFFSTKLDYCEINTLDGVLITTSYGRGLVRGSNTQPVVCFRFESDTQEGLEKIKLDFYDQLQKYINKSDLINSFLIK